MAQTKLIDNTDGNCKFGYVSEGVEQSYTADFSCSYFNTNTCIVGFSPKWGLTSAAYNSSYIFECGFDAFTSNLNGVSVPNVSAYNSFPRWDGTPWYYFCVDSETYRQVEDFVEVDCDVPSTGINFSDLLETSSISYGGTFNYSDRRRLVSAGTEDNPYWWSSADGVSSFVPVRYGSGGTVEWYSGSADDGIGFYNFYNHIDGSAYGEFFDGGDTFGDHNFRKYNIGWDSNANRRVGFIVHLEGKNGSATATLDVTFSRREGNDENHAYDVFYSAPGLSATTIDASAFEEKMIAASAFPIGLLKSVYTGEASGYPLTSISAVKLRGNFGVLVESSDDNNRFSSTCSRYSSFGKSNLLGAFPQLFLNRSYISYFVSGEGNFYLATGDTIPDTTTKPDFMNSGYCYIPSYRFRYGYMDSDEFPYKTTIQYLGKRPIPIDSSVVAPTSVIKDIEASYYLDDTQYNSFDSFIENSEFNEWPMVPSEKVSGHTLVCLYPTDCLVSGDGETRGKTELFKSLDCLAFDKASAATINVEVEPLIYMNHPHFPMCVNYSNEIDDSYRQDGKIRRNGVKNMFLVSKIGLIRNERSEDMYKNEISYTPYYKFSIDGIDNLANIEHGTITFRSMNAASLRVKYVSVDDGSEIIDSNPTYERESNQYLINASIVNNGYDYKLSEILVRYSNLNVIDPFVAVEYYKTMPLHPTSETDDFFGNRNASGYGLYYGTGIFDSKFDGYDTLETTAISSAGPGNKTIYNFHDDVMFDAKTSVDLDGEIRNFIGISSTDDVDEPDDSESMWYLYVDKTEDSADDAGSIVLDVLDAKGTNSQGGWVDIEVPDVTEKLQLSTGGYTLPAGREYATSIPDGISNTFTEKHERHKRIKVRFRLRTTGDEAILNENGFRVVLGYRVKVGDLYKDYDVRAVRLLPLSKKCNGTLSIGESTYDVESRDYYTFLDSRGDINADEYGFTYCDGIPSSAFSSCHQVVAKMWYNVNGTESSSKYVLISNYNKVSDSVVKGWEINSNETGNSISNIPYPSNVSNEKVYYVCTKWTENIDISDDSIFRVYRSRGTYVKSKKDFRFTLNNDESIKFYDDIKFVSAGNNKHYESVTAYGAAEGSHKCEYKGSSVSNMEIYNIDTSLNSGKIKFNVSPHSIGSNIDVKIGSFDRDPIATISGDSATAIEVSPNSDFTYNRNDKTMECRLFLIRGEGVETEIPNTYNSFIGSSAFPSDEGGIFDGADIYTEQYYPILGGFYLKLADYQSFGATASAIPTITKEDGQFYIMNKFKMLGASMSLQLDDVQSTGANRIELTDYITNWSVSCSIDGVQKWKTSKDYLTSNNNNRASAKLSQDYDDTIVGNLGYGKVGYNIKMDGMVSFSYRIVINGVPRIVVTKYYDENDEHGAKSGVSYENIKCVPYIGMRFKNLVTRAGTTESILNTTDNSVGAFSGYDISLNTGESYSITGESYDVVIPKTQLNQIVGTVYGNLTYDWAGSNGEANDENLTRIIATETPNIYVLNSSDYDPEITRVLGGSNLKYPYGRSDILFSPNDWLTAENVNKRFDMIFENLNYFSKQTSLYLNPPSLYSGYFGDFYAVFNGRKQRMFGFVRPDELEIYKDYTEMTSLDDDKTVARGCNAICVDSNSNIYIHRDGVISVYANCTYNSYLGKIVPAKINEFMSYIDRIEYSSNTGLLYLLSKKTHKLYIFNSFGLDRDEGVKNLSYNGEIGGYGGPAVHSKFNHPNDFYISSIDNPDGTKTEEIWVCDQGNNVIKHFSIKGQWISTIDLSEIDYKILGVCVDYNHIIYVLTQNYVFKFNRDGDVVGAFELHAGVEMPIMIRPQHMSGFLYVLYEHHVEKYDHLGNYIGKFAETDELSYFSMCASNNHDIYITTNKNILVYNDSFRLRKIAVPENAENLSWRREEVFLNRNDNIQDVILNTSFQRMYDNIVMYMVCVFGKIMNVVADDDESRIVDLDQSEYQELYESKHKERIFVGINELVTVDVLNRVFSLMFDLLEKMLSSI